MQHRRKHTQAREQTGTRTGRRQWREKGPVGSCGWRRKAHTTRTERAWHAGTREAPTNARRAGAHKHAQAQRRRKTVASEGVGIGVVVVVVTREVAMHVVVAMAMVIGGGGKSNAGDGGWSQGGGSGASLGAQS